MWQKLQPARGELHRECRARCALTNRVADLSLTGFADDLLKKLLVHWKHESVESVVRHIGGLVDASLAQLQEQLMEGQFALNQDKTVILPWFSGAGAWTAMRRLQEVLGRR